MPVISEVLLSLAVKFSVENDQPATTIGSEDSCFLVKNVLILSEIKSQFLDSSFGNVWKLNSCADPLSFNSKKNFKLTKVLQREIKKILPWFTNQKKNARLLLLNLLSTKYNTKHKPILLIFSLKKLMKMKLMIMNKVLHKMFIKNVWLSKFKKTISWIKFLYFMPPMSLKLLKIKYLLQEAFLMINVTKKWVKSEET